MTRWRVAIAALALTVPALAGAAPAQEPIATYTGSFAPLGADLPILANEIEIRRFATELHVTFRIEVTVSQGGGESSCASFEGDFTAPITVDPGGNASFEVKDVSITEGFARFPCETGLAFQENPTTVSVLGEMTTREITGTVSGPFLTFDFSAALAGLPPQEPSTTGPDLLSVPDTPLSESDIEGIARKSTCGVPLNVACKLLIRESNERFESIHRGQLDEATTKVVRRAVALTLLREDDGSNNAPLLLPTLAQLIPVITKLGVTASSGGSDAAQARSAMQRLIRLAITMDLGTNL